uniref:protein-tyrosine-phosphatase n=1 Tax=Chelydra serpentina TaxID=8475 RepID=A0A8C3SAN8_CHESE
ALQPLQIGPFSIVQVPGRGCGGSLGGLSRRDTTPLHFLSQTRFPPQEERPLTHFQYVAWPDRGIPDNYSHFLEMIEHVRLTQGGDPAPVCVHCSAGCGRTGVICILEHVRHLLLQQSIPPNFSIFDIVLAMRKQRPSAVQTLVSPPGSPPAGRLPRATQRPVLGEGGALGAPPSHSPNVAVSPLSGRSSTSFCTTPWPRCSAPPWPPPSTRTSRR